MSTNRVDIQRVVNVEGRRRARHLKCSCCGEGAGWWVQFHNLDTGHGLCARCADWIRFRKRAKSCGMRPLEFLRTYGEAGYNRPGDAGDLRDALVMRDCVVRWHVERHQAKSWEGQLGRTALKAIEDYHAHVRHLVSAFGSQVAASVLELAELPADQAKAVVLSVVRPPKPRESNNGDPDLSLNDRNHPCECGGLMWWQDYCGAYVCERENCGRHKNLARCYCGWPHGRGRRELEDLGETIGDGL